MDRFIKYNSLYYNKIASIKALIEKIDKDILSKEPTSPILENYKDMLQSSKELLMAQLYNYEKEHEYIINNVNSSSPTIEQAIKNMEQA